MASFGANHTNGRMDGRSVAGTAPALQSMMAGLKTNTTDNPFWQSTRLLTFSVDMSRTTAIETDTITRTCLLIVVDLGAEGTGPRLGHISTVGFNMTNLSASITDGGNVSFPIPIQGGSRGFVEGSF